MQYGPTHLPVNWVDGMKITRSHLTEFERYVTEQAVDSIGVGLTEHSYGLMPGQEMDLRIQCDHRQQVSVSILTCQAVTLGGFRIAINEPALIELHTSVREILAEHQLSADKEYSFAIVLTVNPFERIPTGEPRQGEMPPRQPYTAPSYQLSIIPFDLIHSPAFHHTHLTVGKLIYQHQELKSQMDYVPPCAAVNTHTALRNWYRTFGGLLLDIETNGFKIIQKIRTRNQPTPLGDSILRLMERMVYSIAGLKTSYRWMVPLQPPVQMIEHVLQLIHTCQTSIDCQTDREREELLGYFAEWSEVTPGLIDQQLKEFSQLKYNHADVLPTILAVEAFMRLMADLLLKLSQLEYIGKRKGQVVFIGENRVGEPSPEKPKPRWSPV